MCLILKVFNTLFISFRSLDHLVEIRIFDFYETVFHENEFFLKSVIRSLNHETHWQRVLYTL